MPRSSWCHRYIVTFIVLFGPVCFTTKYITKLIRVSLGLEDLSNLSWSVRALLKPKRQGLSILKIHFWDKRCEGPFQHKFQICSQKCNWEPFCLPPSLWSFLSANPWKHHFLGCIFDTRDIRGVTSLKTNLALKTVNIHLGPFVNRNSRDYPFIRYIFVRGYFRFVHERVIATLFGPHLGRFIRANPWKSLLFGLKIGWIQLRYWG